MTVCNLVREEIFELISMSDLEEFPNNRDDPFLPPSTGACILDSDSESSFESQK